MIGIVLVEPYTTKREIPQLRGFGSLFNAEECHEWLKKQKDMVGWTYTINLTAIFRYHFRRIISGQLPTWPQGETEVRYAINTHIKCYVAKKEMLVGSFNLTGPTIQDCCVRITNKKELLHMKQQFDRHWKSLSPCKTL